MLPNVGDTPSLPAAGSTTPGIAGAAARIPGGPTLPEIDPVSMGTAIARMANDLFAMPPHPASSAGNPYDPPTSTPNATPGGAPSPQGAMPGSSTQGAMAPGSPSPMHPQGVSPINAGRAPNTRDFGSIPDLKIPGNAFPASTPGLQSGASPNGTLPSNAPSSPFDAPLNFAAFDQNFAQIDHPLASLFVNDSLNIPLLDSTENDRTPATTNAAPSLTRSPATTRDPAKRESASQPSPATREPTFANIYEIAPHTDLGLRSTRGDALDPNALKAEFPILRETVNGKRLVWLDNAATTQKPQAVIDRVKYYYEHENSNVHRAAHTLAARSTDAYESARESVRRFINAPSKNEVIFVRGTTEGINLISQSWGRRNIDEGDEIVITWLEHHANIVPWQQLALERKAKLRVAPVDSRGQIILSEYEKLLNSKTRLVSLTQVSNALGTITPAKEMVEIAHRYGAKVVVDGAQAVSHKRVDVQDLGADFFVFSGHKVFGPFGIGAVFGRSELLEAMPPWQTGGNMIQDVTFEHTTFQPPPFRFEAGTGNIADAVGLGAALDWVTRVGIERIESYEHELLLYATEQLHTVPGLKMIGTAPEKAGVLSFILDGQKTEEVGGLLDREGIAVRSGHHCAQPILRRFGLEATVRASLAPYNTCEDIDALVAALHRLQAGRG
jgi:cysteine desulfurase/selenocysteine lyase